VFKSKGQSGKPLCTNPPYGYTKDPEDKLHWIVDDEAAEVVREIFHLCMSGYGPTKISNILEQRKIENPVAHGARRGLTLPAKSTDNDPYVWHDSTISRLLTRQEYLGHTVNFKTYRKSYKNKKQLNNDASEWQIFENTHETIIDQETFDIVQRIRNGRRRLTPMGEMPVLSGMLFCADCGNKLYQVRGRGWEHDKEYFVCATYRKKKGGCSSHQIRNVVIEQLLLDDIRRASAFAQEHEDEFLQLVTTKSKREAEKSLRDSKLEFEQAQARISKLDGIIQRLYEDNIEGKVSDERYAKMSATYEAEQKQLEIRAAELGVYIHDTKEKSLNADYFLEKVKKYTDIRELDAEIIRELVEKIIVHKVEKIDGRRVQRITIHYNGIGAIKVPTPSEEEKTA
jgi:hypothetical protein